MSLHLHLTASSMLFKQMPERNVLAGGKRLTYLFLLREPFREAK